MEQATGAASRKSKNAKSVNPKMNHVVEKYLKNRINHKLRVIENDFSGFEGILRRIDESNNLYFEKCIKFINPLKLQSYGNMGESVYLESIKINCEDMLSFEVKERVQEHGNFRRTSSVPIPTKRVFLGESSNASGSQAEAIPLPFPKSKVNKLKSVPEVPQETDDPLEKK